MVICETELRALLGSGSEKVVRLRRGDFVTPSARDFLEAHQFRIEYVEPSPYGEMGQTPLPRQGVQRRFVDTDGRTYAEKPEHMTHLHGNVLVPKNHPRIALRGKLDSLQADILAAQVAAVREGFGEVADDLQELLAHSRELLASEVTELPIEPGMLLGLDDAGLRAVSHNPREHYGSGHPVPDHRMGATAVAINSVRTRVREAELVAVSAFTGPDGIPTRPDMIQALNRFSSAVYIVLCRLLGGYYRRQEHGQ